MLVKATDERHGGRLDLAMPGVAVEVDTAKTNRYQQEHEFQNVTVCLTHGDSGGTQEGRFRRLTLPYGHLCRL